MYPVVVLFGVGGCKGCTVRDGFVFGTSEGTVVVKPLMLVFFFGLVGTVAEVVVVATVEVGPGYV